MDEGRKIEFCELLRTSQVRRLWRKVELDRTIVRKSYRLASSENHGQYSEVSIGEWEFSVRTFDAEFKCFPRKFQETFCEPEITSSTAPLFIVNDKNVETWAKFYYARGRVLRNIKSRARVFFFFFFFWKLYEKQDYESQEKQSCWLSLCSKGKTY